MEIKTKNLLLGLFGVFILFLVVSYVFPPQGNGITVAHDGEFTDPVYSEADFKYNYDEASNRYDVIVERAEAGEFEGSYENYQLFKEAYSDWDDYAYPARMAYRNSNNTEFLTENEWRYEDLVEQNKDMFEKDMDYHVFPEDL